MLPQHQLCLCGSSLNFKLCCSEKTSEEILEQSSNFPLHECLVGIDAWRTSGIAMVLVSRRVSEDLYIFGMYFLDTYCLGLKDTFAAAKVSEERYMEVRQQLTTTVDSQLFDYEDCRSLILGCITFAGRLGFDARGEWQSAKFVIEAERDYEPKFEFGKNGKPYYVQGLHEDPGDIILQLERTETEYAIGAQWGP